MYQSLGITQEQMFSEVYSAWLRDTQEKRGDDSRQLFRGVVEGGFLERQISLPRQRIGINVLTSLSTLLYRSTLTKLDLYGNTLRDAGLEVLAQLLRDLPQLLYLNIGANGITGSSGMQHLSTGIALHKKLSTFLIGSNRNDPYANHITPASMCVLLEGCLRCRTLRVLDLSGCTLDGPTVLTTEEEGNPEDSGDGAATQPRGEDSGMGGTAGGGTRPSLHPVGLLVALLQSSTTITALQLKDTALTVSGALQIVQALYSNTTLTDLDLGYNQLNAKVGDALGGLLQSRVAMQHTCALKKLCLSGNDLFGNLKGLVGGANSVQAARSLRQQRHANPNYSETAFSFSTSGKSGWGETYSSLQRIDAKDTPSGPLLAVLANDRSLTHLELDACGVSGVSLALLCRSLSVNIGLKVLSIKHNHITPEDASLLGGALCRHGGLKRLYVSGNLLEDEGGCAFAKLVEVSGGEGLEVLDLRCTWLGDKSLIALGVALQQNTSLRVLLLDDNHFTYKGCEAFAAFVEQNNSLLSCPLGATSAPYPIQLRIERATQRNNKKLDNEEADALKREVVRLHYQSYKLEEARAELDSLKEKSADVKRTTENTDIQFKQDHSDYNKKIRELKEQIENYTNQEVSYKKQAADLEEELTKQRAQFEEDMELVKQRLEAEVAMREKMEVAFREAEETLRYVEGERPERERSTAREGGRDQEGRLGDWSTQRKQYKADSEALEKEVAQLEEELAAKAQKAAERKKSTVSVSSTTGKKKKK
ncbi:hypothetical protein AGDE_10076 [Angomonas deanei]|uniref:Leucine Rich repeat, putative n=1 Tax=Angomonas deanei TaxID=59799 RepID=A0A7G2CKW3_9TRYP|nr:hypothetical protein AGDE_10076 [Angomonas deanei]CAD2219213.1 Leucine Rich repeat, putative [Angomonas deanei]|eukprot:EPY29198.1 hypothetical protein AGDE_10076 [Angomonas deanei]